MSKSDIVTYLQQKHIFTTAVFNYSLGKWSEGSDISIVVVNNIQYLRTDPDRTAKDNLSNLLLIDELR